MAPYRDLTQSSASPAVAADMPRCGVTVGTKVLTLDGLLPVQFLATGERLVTRRGARVLTAVIVSLQENAEMIRIAPGAFGQGQPEADLFIAPDQPIIFGPMPASQPKAQQMLATNARALVDGTYIRRERVAELRLFSLHFAEAEVIYAGGLQLQCPPLPAARQPG